MFRLSRTLRPLQSPFQPVQRRFLSIHEYRGAQLLKMVSFFCTSIPTLTWAQYGVGVPQGYPAFTPEEAEQVAEKLGNEFE